MTLTERTTGKVLYSRPNFEMKQRYEISIDPEKYFEESDTALDRLSQEAARQLCQRHPGEFLSPEQFLQRISKQRARAGVPVYRTRSVSTNRVPQSAGGTLSQQVDRFDLVGGRDADPRSR